MVDLLNIVIPPLGDSYTYKAPVGYDHPVDVGFQVEISLGRRHAQGFVVSRYEEQSLDKFPFELKEISKEEPPTQCFLPSQLPFFSWISEYYCEPLSNVIDVAVPASAPSAPILHVHLVTPDAQLKGQKEREILALLRDSPGNTRLFSEITKQLRGSGAAIHRLVKKGVLRISEEERLDLPFLEEPAPTWTKDRVDLSEAQQQSVEEISKYSRERTFAPVLLHGVTGSGKTEVYIEAMKNTLAAGRGALVIVPEIALTPQLIDRFRVRLGAPISVLHSAMSKRHRWNSWRALLEGKTRVAIGARSGLFAPVHDLGLIIVDEEHDPSYKQGEGLRYNARDLALVLGKLSQCPVVLGSATPSLETFNNAITKRYVYHSLSNRYAQGSPVQMTLVDMNRCKPWDMPSRHISPQLYDALKQTIEKGEQAFLLYNRRGFASYLQCEKCEEVLTCENCSVTLTYHRSQNSLVCHYCNLSVIVPSRCPVCPPEEGEGAGPGALAERGGGTEKIYEEIVELFPTTVVERLDRDSAADHGSYRSILDRLRAGEVQVLVGTQMIAKGHDLPRVTTVGIVDCDVGLHLPDFRASERVFQLLTQAAGRCGRAGTGGTVILQTRVPTHGSLVKTVLADYKGFAEIELNNRKQLRYPPFVKMARIVVSSQDRALPPQILQLYRSVILARKKDGADVEVLGPAPAPIERIKTLWRYHMLLKSPSSALLNSIIRQLQSIDLKTNKARLVFDTDPQEML